MPTHTASARTTLPCHSPAPMGVLAKQSRHARHANVALHSTPSPRTGSRQGGNPLTVYTNSSSAPFNSTHPGNNIVTISSLPCTVIPGSVTNSSLTCNPTPLVGRVLAEFWQLSTNTNSHPDLENFQNPGVLGGVGVDTKGGGRQCRKAAGKLGDGGALWK